ncbi:hypothetical protein Tco_1421886, partial [Tanacetum coccineum]
MYKENISTHPDIMESDSKVEVVFDETGNLRISTSGKDRSDKGYGTNSLNLGLRRITDQFGPQAIRFKWNDRGTLMPLDDHAAHWANLLREIVREFPMYFRSWHNILEERKA